MNTHTTEIEDFFSACYLQYREIIQKYIASRIYYSHESEDLMQDVFVRLWEYKAFVNKETVRPLLFTMARNLITDKIRRYYKKEEFTSYIYKIQETSRNTTEETVFSHELLSLLIRFVCLRVRLKDNYYLPVSRYAPSSNKNILKSAKLKRRI